MLRIFLFILIGSCVSLKGYAQEYFPFDTAIFDRSLLARVKSVTETRHSTTANNTVTTLTTFDERGKPLRSETTGSGERRIALYTYDPHGTLEQYSVLNNDKLESKIEYSIDERGAIAAERRYSSVLPGDAPRFSGESFYEHHANGALKRRIITSTEDHDTMEIDRYDELGRLRETDWGKNYQWLTKTIFRWNSDNTEMREEAFGTSPAVPVLVVLNRYHNGKKILSITTSFIDTTRGRRIDTLIWKYDTLNRLIEAPLSPTARMHIRYNSIGLPSTVTYFDHDWPEADPYEETRYQYEWRR